MLKCKFTMLAVPAAMLAVASMTANASVVGFKDSADFVYKYEMDVNPSTQDLDSNGTVDFFAGTAGNQTIPQTYQNGLAFSNQSATPAENLFRTDFGDSITRATLSADTHYTIEVRVAKESGTQGTQGWFGMVLQSPGTSQSIRFMFKDDEVTVRTTGGTFTPFLTGTNFTEDFHTVRIAYVGSNEYFVWVDEILLNADLDTPLNGGNGNAWSGGGWLIGDFSADTAGEWKVDYIRFDNTGAYNAIPEPASLALLGLGGLLMLRRRRK